MIVSFYSNNIVSTQGANQATYLIRFSVQRSFVCLSTMINELSIDSNQQFTSIERDKNNEIFDRLLKFGIESVREFLFIPNHH
jgi:hypothetical protein